jgi:heme-degrading monooxygenase HmoA
MAWANNILKEAGVIEFRAYRNPAKVTPQVMVSVEFDSIEAAEKFANSDAHSKNLDGLKELGIHHFSTQLWDTSPVVPVPLKPAA